MIQNWRQRWWVDFEVAGIEELRRDSFQFLLLVTALAYAAWHFGWALLGTTGSMSAGDIIRHWLLFILVAAGLSLAQHLHQDRLRLAIQVFLVTSVLAIMAALWLLQTPQATILIPVVALVAVVLLHPLVGLITTAGSTGLLLLLHYDHGPLSFLSGSDIAEVAVGSLLTVAVAWMLARSLLIAVDWSTKSYAEAARNAREARTNRGELMQALKQLDYAYYQLQQANVALELAWKAADASERSKLEFVSNISHELRTPLNLIIGFSELVLNSPETYHVPLPAAYRGDLNVIYRSAQHLLTLTDDVIDLARVGMGRLALMREPIDLRLVIQAACDLIRAYVEAKRLSLQITVEPDLPPISLDHLRVRQVLLNLLTNAARFTQQGGITVVATCIPGGVHVAVRDTGAGIAPVDLARIFEEYHHEGRSSGHTEDRFGGVGLGLPLSRHLVELHGGQMGVESTMGQGTTFWFTLPTEPALVQNPAPWPGQISSSLTPDRVIVLAGADADLAAFLGRHLHGYRVLHAEEGEQAAITARDTRALAIVASDRVAPAGLQATGIPVIRAPLPHVDQWAAHLGAVAYLTKPVTRSKLHAAIARLAHPVSTILIVDDDLRFVRLLARMLTGGGSPGQRYTALAAHNGEEALEILATARPDLVLVDWIMPGLGGREVIAAMRAQPVLADIPVIIISAQDQLLDQFPLDGVLSMQHPDGFELEALLGSLEGLLSTLMPPHGDLGTWSAAKLTSASAENS